MTNEKAVEALKEIKTYTAANLLDAVDYVIEVLQALEEAGIKNPEEIKNLKK